MKAVIPCTKKENALYPFIETKPTGMMPVIGKPLIRNLVGNLRDAGVEEIFLVTNYREGVFEEEFEDDEDIETLTQKEIDSVAGAVEECSSIEDDFLVVTGETAVSSTDLERLIQTHQNQNSEVTVLGADDATSKFGVLKQEGSDLKDMESDFEEAEMVNTGIYAFSPDIFAVFEETGEEELVSAVSQLLEEENGKVVDLEDYWVNIGSPRDLWQADRIIRENEIQETEIHENAEVHKSTDITGKAIIEEGARIKPGTVIEGTVYIGKNCTVGPNTLISDSTVCYESQVRASEISSSLLFERNIIDSSTVLEDAVMGEETDVKSNTTVRESFIGPGSYIEMNNSIYGVKFVPDARTDLGEISK